MPGKTEHKVHGEIWAVNFTSFGKDPFAKGHNDNFELLKAWGGTSLAFAIFMAQSDARVYNLGSYLLTLALYLAISAVTCGVGMVLHELAHRTVARHYGAQAHFAANNGWLLISIAIAFLGVFVAAPGAVWHRGYLSTQQSGLIALAGPATNLLLGLGFFLMLPLVGSTGAHFWHTTFFVGYYINSWIGLFNMIPAGPFDGAKVFYWNRVVFGITVALALFMVFVLRNFV